MFFFLFIAEMWGFVDNSHFLLASNMDEVIIFSIP
jgi:hypothetical protein